MSPPSANFTELDRDTLVRTIAAVGDALKRDVMPQTRAMIPLRPNETLHVLTAVEWNELVREQDRREVFERLRHVASGSLGITDQRLIFNGAERKSSIEYRDVIDTTIVDSKIRVEVVGPHDPYFSILPSDAQSVVHSVIEAAVERSRLNKRARLMGGPHVPPHDK